MRFVSFLASKGGAGKSMLTRLVASELACSGMPVRVFCADHPQHTTWEWFEAIKDRSATPTTLEVDRINGIDELASYLKNHGGTDGYGLIDVKGDATQELALAIGVSSVVIVPSRVSMDDAQPAIRLIDYIKRVGETTHTDPNIWVALNDVSMVDFRTQTYRTVEQAFRDAGVSVFETPVIHRTMFAELANGKATLQEMATTKKRIEQVRRARDNISRLLIELLTKAGEKNG